MLLKKFKLSNVDLLIFKASKEAIKSSIIDFGTYTIKEGPTDVYCLWDGESLAHKSKIFRKSYILTSLNYPSPIITIGDCLTPDKYRGKGLYPKMLRYLITKFSVEHNVYILVDPDNIASIKGIEKAGFQKISRVKAKKFGPFYFQKQVENFA